MVRGKKGLNGYREPIYTPYVQHCLRFYSRYLHIKDFRNDTDKLNWYACHRAIQAYSPTDQDILVYVYGERDTLADNVYNVSIKYGIHQDFVWEMMREFERKVAVERGLV